MTEMGSCALNAVAEWDKMLAEAAAIWGVPVRFLEAVGPANYAAVRTVVDQHRWAEKQADMMRRSVLTFPAAKDA